MYAESGQPSLAMLCMSQGTHPVMLPTTGQTQLLAVQQEIQDVKAELQQVKQDLATARADDDPQEVDFLRKRVESIDKQLSCLREKDNILLRDQLGGGHNMQLLPQARMLMVDSNFALLCVYLICQALCWSQVPPVSDALLGSHTA